MSAVIYRLRSTLRRSWTSTLVLASIIGGITAVVITLAAGAHRTANAPDRFTAQWTPAVDGMILQETDARLRADEIAALPDVESAASVTYIFGGISPPNGEFIEASVFAGLPEAAGTRLVSGRAADPADEHEFVASRSFVDLTGASIGDTFDLATLTEEQAVNGWNTPDFRGPRLTEQLVGIVDGPSRLDDPSPIVVVSPALLSEPDLGVAATVTSIDLRPGASLSQLRSQLDTLPGGEALSLQPAKVISDTIRRAVQTQALGLWILASVALIASIAVLGQMVTRQVRPSAAERERLSAIGFSRRQIVATAVGAALIPIVLGSLVGAALAIIPSALFPTGFVRVIEPSPGAMVDTLVLVAGALILIVAITSWTLVSLVLQRAAPTTPLPSPTIEALATRTADPAAATGLRLAFARGAGRAALRGAIVGLTLTVAGVTTAITFASSLDRLIDQPFRYGRYYDAAIGDNGGDALPDGLVDVLDRQPDVTSLTLFAGSSARVGDVDVPVLGMDNIRGNGAPPVLSGRLPIGDDEIALGRRTASAIDARVGGEITLVGGTATRSFRVTGLVVVPGLGSNDGIGEGGVVTTDGLARIDDVTRPTSAAVQLRDDPASFLAAVPELADQPPQDLFVPPAIVNLGRVRSIPVVLAGILGVLALLTVGQVMLTSTRAERRGLATLRSLGATARWIGRAVHWQATLFTLFCLAWGVPTGIVVGRLVFGAFARNLGTVDDAAIPWALATVGMVLIVVLANVATAIPARRARRERPAQLLRTE